LDKKIYTSADRKLSQLLPRYEIIERWSQESPLQGSHRFVTGIELYKDSMQHEEDKELFRFMPSRFHWDEPFCISESAPFIFHWPQGAFIQDLDSFLQEHPLWQAYMTAWQSPFYALTYALGAAHVLYIPAKARGRISLKELPQNTSTLSFTLLIAESGAEVLIEPSPQGARLSSLLGFVARDAHVTFIEDYDYAPDYFTIQTQLWVVDTHSKLSTYTGLTGGAQTWFVKDVILEQNAQMELAFLSALKENEQSSLITRQCHRGASSQSSVLVKSLLLDAAQSFYRGTISMNKEAAGSCADQQQRALILGQRARTCAIPSLEVATHDVSCKHGSAAGRFDENELWYLQSRGLEKKTAYDLLVEGFYNDCLGGREEPYFSPVLERLKQRHYTQNTLT